MEWTTALWKEELWKRLQTLSQVAALEGEGLVEARKVFDEAVDGEQTERDGEGRIVVRGSTFCVWTKKL